MKKSIIFLISINCILFISSCSKTKLDVASPLARIIDGAVAEIENAKSHRRHAPIVAKIAKEFMLATTRSESTAA